VLGVLWVVVQPLLGAGALSIVFGSVAKLKSGNVPYFLLAFVGMFWWSAASQALTRVAGSLVANAQLVSKVYFPRLVLPLALLWSGLLDTAVTLPFLVALMLAIGPPVTARVLLAPIWLLCGLMLALGIGLVATALSVKYRDIQQVLPLAVQLLFLASPVAYRLQNVPTSLRFLFSVNPCTGLLEAFRWSTIGGSLPTGAVVWAVTASLSSLLVGLLFFARWERVFADVI
jgi:lipopolysaccharide transport system permease protein